MTEKRPHGIKPDIVLRVYYQLAPEPEKPRVGPEQPFYAEPEKLEMWNAIFGD